MKVFHPTEAYMVSGCTAHSAGSAHQAVEMFSDVECTRASGLLQSQIVHFWGCGGWEALVRLRAAGPPSLRARHSLRSVPCNGASNQAVAMFSDAQQSKPVGVVAERLENALRPLLGVRGMGGSPRTKCDVLSLERGAQPEASTPSEGSAPPHAAAN
jgi:hypothetical protein